MVTGALEHRSALLERKSGSGARELCGMEPNGGVGAGSKGVSEEMDR